PTWRGPSNEIYSFIPTDSVGEPMSDATGLDSVLGPLRREGVMDILEFHRSTNHDDLVELLRLASLAKASLEPPTCTGDFEAWAAALVAAKNSKRPSFP